MRPKNLGSYSYDFIPCAFNVCIDRYATHVRLQWILRTRHSVTPLLPLHTINDAPYFEIIRLASENNFTPRPRAHTVDGCAGWRLFFACPSVNLALVTHCSLCTRNTGYCSSIYVRVSAGRNT